MYDIAVIWRRQQQVRSTSSNALEVAAILLGLSIDTEGNIAAISAKISPCESPAQERSAVIIQ